jgi:hypothetical protein
MAIHPAKARERQKFSVASLSIDSSYFSLDKNVNWLYNVTQGSAPCRSMVRYFPRS